MTLQQIEYVLAVARTGSFSKAAAECFVTQPTLSVQVQKLEQELGVPLLDRSRKPVTPTELGGLFVSKAQEISSLMNEIPAMLKEERETLDGRLVLGIIPTLSQYLLPLFLKPFLERHPRLHLEIHEKTSAHIIKGIRDKQIDLGILALPVAEPGLEETPLFSEEFIGYFPTGYWNSAQDPAARLHASELRREDMLLLAEGHCLRNQVINICRYDHPTTTRLEFETGSLEALKAMVNQGLGYTLLPELATMNLGPEQKARLRYLSEPCPTRNVGLIHPKGFHRTRLLKTLEAAIKSSLPDKIRRNTNTLSIPWRSTSEVRG